MSFFVTICLEMSQFVPWAHLFWVAVATQCFRFLMNIRNALTTATNGVATIPAPSTISSSVMLSESVGMVIWAGIIWGAGVGRGAGGEVDELSVEGSGEGSEDTARSVFGLDVGDELPTVMFLTVSALTVKLYS